MFLQENPLFNPVHRLRSSFRLSSLLLCSGVLASTAAVAQNGQQPEEVIVTADFRGNSLQGIPGSVSVLNADFISEQNATHLEEVLSNLPNVNFASGASRARFFQIRGIGERGQYAEPLNPSVGLLIDGIDYSGAGTISTLYDIEQVEVLLGPQGTRYGSNALAGLINLQSKSPTDIFTSGFQAQLANQDTTELAGYASGPLSDSLFFRISGQQFKSDGYSTNLTLNRPTNTRDEQTFRGQLLWQANDGSTFRLHANLTDLDNGYDAFSLDNIRDTISDEPGVDRQHSDSLSAVYKTMFDSLELQALASISDTDIEYGYDEDWTYVGFHPWEYSSTDYYFRDRKNNSIELRLLSQESSSRSWVAGVYMLNQEVDLEREYTYLDENYFSQHAVDRIAVYADTTHQLGASVFLDFGLRAERFESEFSDSYSVAFNPEDTLLGGRLSLRKELDSNTMIYGGISRGYKTGGFNTDGSLDSDLREFDAEYLWNYEAGLKAWWPQSGLSLQTAVFYMDRDDVQISSSTTRDRQDGSKEFIDFTGNAAAGSNYGIELNAQWLASARFHLNGSLGLLKSEYEDFINSAGDDLDGREQAHAPGWQYSLTGNWQLSSDLTGSLTLQGKDSFYFSDSHDIQSTTYHTINASLLYTAGRWSVRLWGRNLTDEDYYVRGYYFANDPRDGYAEPHGYTQLGENRRYGITVKFDM